MRLPAWAFINLLLLLSLPALASPVYRAGEKGSLRSVLHGEVSASYLFSSHQVQSFTKEDVSEHLKGMQGRALWAPLGWLAVGAEFTSLQQTELLPMVEKYKTHRTAGVVKLTLSPNTNPRFYLLAGLGKSQHRLEYNRSFRPVRRRAPVDKDFSYWTVALGTEADVWKFIFIAAEGSLLRYSGTKLANYYELTSRTETALHLRAGIRF